MTNLINQITINGKTTTFLNYVNPLIGGESIATDSSNWYTFLTQQLTSARVSSYNNIYGGYSIRLNPPYETLSGQVQNASGLGANGRFFIQMSTLRAYFVNTTNSTGSSLYTASPQTYTSPYIFAVINDYAMSIASFATDGRTSGVEIASIGWAKDGLFTGSQYPRNFYAFGDRSDSAPSIIRTTAENSTSQTSIGTSNPSLSCAISTPGSDSTDILLRDSASPNNYIGKMWHMMMLPSSAVLGKIYKNTGVDPDTGNVETDQKAFWMCVGSWGGNKLGMRVWTENIT